MAETRSFGRAQTVDQFTVPGVRSLRKSRRFNQEPGFLNTLSERSRLLVVVYTYRGDHIRIISARKATRREVKSYEG